MKNCNAPEHRNTRRILLVACATALAVAFTVGLPQPAHADHVTPPKVPDRLVPTGATAFLVGHAVGTQNYVCLPSGAGFRFVLFTPEATLFGDNEKQVITHYFSPNPDEDGTPIRATWQDSHDTSTVWASATQMATNATDPQFVQAGAVAWLLLQVVGSQSGPIGSNKLAPTTFIQRVNTSGGLAPLTGCDSLADVGHEAFVPYTADYFFYTGGN
jgi:Protein of unknown function (DUF3455)